MAQCSNVSRELTFESCTRRTERWHATAEKMEQFEADGLIWQRIFQGKEQRNNEKGEEQTKAMI